MVWFWTAQPQVKANTCKAIRTKHNGGADKRTNPHRAGAIHSRGVRLKASAPPPRRRPYSAPDAPKPLQDARRRGATKGTSARQATAKQSAPHAGTTAEEDDQPAPAKTMHQSRPWMPLRGRDAARKGAKASRLGAECLGRGQVCRRSWRRQIQNGCCQRRKLVTSFFLPVAPRWVNHRSFCRPNNNLCHQDGVALFSLIQ